MSDENNYEIIITKLLDIIAIGNILKISIREYEEKINDLLKDEEMTKLTTANNIFDIIQSLEMLNSNFHANQQKLFKIVSKIDVNKTNNTHIKEEKIKKNSEEDFIESKNKEAKQNKLVNNALDYLQDFIKKNIKEERDKDE
tara:strand:+ start:193 stop:618 length:426 start_codon:yes stop_codon:yes gene_type:complete